MRPCIAKVPEEFEHIEGRFADLARDAALDIDPALSLADAHRISHDAEHDLIHALPKPTTAMIHAYPAHDRNAE